MTVTTVHLVDDDESYLRALSRMLTAEGLAVRAHGSAQALLDSVSPATRGCVVADLDMPGMDGLALQAALHSSGVHMPVVILTGHGDIPSTVSAMREGAVDYLEKHAPKATLLAAINQALERDGIESTRQGRADALAQRFAALTRRELEVLREVVAGKMNKQIAAALDISERTVKMHRTSITHKLGVRSVAELVTLAREARLFDHTGRRPG
jgi:FixJ family two-component response regulator